MRRLTLTPRRLIATTLAGVMYVQPLAAMLWTAPTSDRWIAPTNVSTIAPRYSLQASSNPAAPVSVFAPERFTRTNGAPNEFTRTITIPAWVTAQFVLRIENGGPNSRNRVSAATVWMDGVQVVGPSDLNQNVPSLTRQVALAPQSTMRVRLASQPGAYFTISVTGTNGDRTGPELIFIEPIGSALNAAPVPVRLRYEDRVGSGEPAASGLQPSTLRVLVDGADRTSSFAALAAEASASLDLAEGVHSIEARIADVAGNVRTAATTFRIDRTVPTTRIVTPALNAYLPMPTPSIRIEYQDETSLNLDTLEVLVNGVDRTPLFSRTPGAATATIPPEVALADGVASIAVRIRDAAGNEASALSTFNVDTIAPQVVIVAPGDAQFTNATLVDVQGGVVDASPVTVRVEGVEASVSGSEFRAASVPVGAAPQVALRAVATDAAGHTGEATVTLRVDRDPPSLSFTSPAPGTYLKGPIIDVSGAVSDASPVLVTINGEPASTAAGSFAGAVPAQDGPLALRAIAVDAAGNTAAADLAITVDSVPPALTITEPAPDLITGASVVRLSGTISDSAPFTVRVGGSVVSVTDGTFSTDVQLPGEGSNTLFVTAADVAGNETTVDVSVTADRTPPQLTIASPDDEAVVASLPFSVQGTVIDFTPVTITVDGAAADVAGNGWSHAVSAGPDGDRTVTVIATDAAGNRTTRTRPFLLDTTAPVLTILAPASGALTNAGSVTVTGTVTDLTLQTVTVNGLPVDPAAPVGTSTPFSAPSVMLGEGENHIVVIATDGTGRSSEAVVHLTRDSIAPSVELTAPERVTRRRPGDVMVDVADPDVAQVTLSINGAPVATWTSPPFQTPLAIPADARPGDQLIVLATATDRAGNSAQASQLVRVAGDGAIVGQVLDDVTGRPLPSATVVYASVGADSGGPDVGAGFSRPDPSVTDERGRYSFASADTIARVTASAPDMTSVTREVMVASETGTVVLDARLTALASEISVGPGGMEIPAGAGTVVSVLAGAVSGPTPLRVTPLSGQGLPALLPLGWSPLRAMDLRIATDPMPAVTLRASSLLAMQLYVARYGAGGWVLVSGPLSPEANGTLTVDLNPVDPVSVFALVAPDPDVMAPAIGEPLPALDVVPIPLNATSTGVVDPPTVSPSGGTAHGTLTVQSPAALPSGTVVQAAVTETFNLANGDVASEEQRTQDLILYRTAPVAPTSDSTIALTAEFPIAPSHTFNVSELASGIVHLDILAGRETVRGQTGGSEPVALTSAGATLQIARGALAEDTAIAFQSAVLSSFLPASGELTPVAEFSLDLSGRLLRIGAELGVPLSTLVGAGLYDPATDTLLVARIERVEGIPRLVVVSLASVSGDRVVSQPYAGMEGLTRGGRYVLYRAAMPIGFLAGGATVSEQPARAIVETLSLPFIGVSGPDGRYLAATRTGSVQVTARVVRTSLRAEAGTEVNARATTALDFALMGAVTSALVMPADGAVAVSPGVQVEITAPNALDAAAVGSASVRLLNLGSATEEPGQAVPVDVRLVLSASGRTLAIVPASRLTANARFRVEAAGLADVFGGAVLVPAVTFVTKADEGPVYDVKKLVVSFPDGNGQVTLTGPEGTLPPGSEVLVINNGSGEVSTFPVFNDGSLRGQFFAALSDRLQITITDTLGNVTTFDRNTYVDTDGTTSVNEGGGIIEGPTGAELRVPKGALDPFDVALMKLSAIPQFIFGEIERLGGLPGLVIAGGVHVESPGLKFFTQEVDVAIPAPADAAEGDIFVILRKLQDATETTRLAYESLDYGVVEGQGTKAKIVTASPPFAGYTGGGGDMIAAAVEGFMPGQPLGGVVTGKVLRTVWAPGAPVPTYQPVAGATVSGVDATGRPLHTTVGAPAIVAVSQADGTYALFDAQYTGGPVTVSATTPEGVTVTAIAFEANPQDTKSPGLRFARQIATANLTYPAIQPPQPPTTVDITLTRTVDGVEQSVRDGIVVAGTAVRAHFRPDASSKLVEVTINGGAPLALVADVTHAGEWTLNDAYVPAQAGLYTIVAKAQPPLGDVVPVRLTFRAIAAGGGVSDPLPNDGPIVIDGRTVPKRSATGVAVAVFPQVTFSEPVTGITTASVTLVDPAGVTIPAIVLGIGPDGQPIGAVASAGAAVTSITLQPLVGLKYASTYTLRLTADIADLDDGMNGTPAHKPLTPYTTTFTTFAPAGLGQTDEGFTSGGLAIVGDRAYVAQNQGDRTRLRLFDVSDPVMPVEITGPDNPSFALHRPPPVFIIGNPADLAVEDASPVTGGRLLAVATNPYSMPFHPANIHLYDVSNDQTWHWIGAVTLGKEPQDGLIKRLVLRGTRLYALVAGQGKGLQVIDLPTARDLFAEKTGGEESFQFYDLMQSLGLQGRGFGESSIVQTVFLETGSGLNSLMHDLAVLDLTIDGIVQPIAVVTGRSPLAVVNPQTGGVLYNGPIRNAAGDTVTSWGFAVETGTINNTPVALVSAVPPDAPATGHVFVVVDLTNPANPQALGTLPLPGVAQSVNDIVLRGTMAYVGTESGTYVVSLDDLSHPQLVSTIAAVGGRLAFTDDRLLFGSVRSNTTLQHALGGVRSVSLGPAVIIESVTPAIVNTDRDGNSIEPLTVTYRVIAVPQDAPVARLRLRRDSNILTAVELPALVAGRFTTTLPSGLRLDPPPDRFEFRLERPDGSLGDAAVKAVAGPGTPEAFQSVGLSPEFESVSPSWVNRGAQDIVLTITGQRLDSVVSVWVGGIASVWTELKVASHSATTITTVLPASATSVEGFLQIAPRPDVEVSLAFLVADPTLPEIGTAADIVVESTDQVELRSDGEPITVRGRGFIEGMTAVLGRNGRVAVPTRVLSSTELEVALSPESVGRAEDLSLAVLSVDKLTLSSTLPIRSSGVPPTVNYDALFPTDQPAITSVLTTPVWNIGDQQIGLEGINLEPGMTVELAAQGTANRRRVVTAPWTGGPPSDARTHRVQIIVPAEDTRWPEICAELVSNSPSGVETGARKCVGAQRPASVPLGGRTKIGIYASTKDAEHLYLVPLPDLQARSVTCTVGEAPRRPRVPVVQASGASQITTSAMFGLAAPPPIPHPLNGDGVVLPPVPLVERESNPCDPDASSVVYLRGVRLSGSNEEVTVSAEVTDADGRRRRGTLKVIVQPGDISAPGGVNALDPVINEVASETGVPPQLLKAQIEAETRFDPTKYRYEPTTIDLFDISGDILKDGSLTRKKTEFAKYINPQLSPGRAVLPPSPTDPPSCVVLLGPAAELGPGEGICTAIGGAAAHSTPTVIAEPDSVRIVARGGLPGSNDYRVNDVTAERINGETSEQVHVVNAPLWSVAEGSAFLEAPRIDELQLDYAKNTVVLGRAMRNGERIRLVFRRVQSEQVGADARCNAFDVSVLNGRAQFRGMSFQSNDTIAVWLKRNLEALGARALLTGTDADQHLEFSRGFDRSPLPGVGTLVLDTRLYEATAQFVAAGSFGLGQQTINGWLTPAKARLLDRVFDLKTRCLHELMTGPSPVRDALRVAAANHLFNRVAPDCALCSQGEWLRRWTEIVRRYNPGAGPYKPVSNAYSGITRRGVEAYGPR